MPSVETGASSVFIWINTKCKVRCVYCQKQSRIIGPKTTFRNLQYVNLRSGPTTASLIFPAVATTCLGKTQWVLKKIVTLLWKSFWVRCPVFSLDLSTCKYLKVLKQVFVFILYLLWHRLPENVFLNDQAVENEAHQVLFYFLSQGEWSSSNPVLYFHQLSFVFILTWPFDFNSLGAVLPVESSDLWIVLMLGCRVS